MSEDDPFSLLCSAITGHREVEFSYSGLNMIIRPHVLYNAADGTLTIAGMNGDIPVHIAVAQIKNLVIAPRYFQPNAAFNLGDSRYRNAHAIV